MIKKKVKKIKLKPKYKAILIIFILILFIFNPVKNVISIKNKGYSLKVSYSIYKKGIKKETLENDYSKTLEEIIKNDLYDKSKLKNYFKIDYYDYENFEKNINKWLDMGYKENDINNINKKNDSSLNEQITKKYISDISSYLKYDFFKTDKLERYISYYNGDYRDTIIKVNIGLDKDYYVDPTIVEKYSTSMIVNKYNKLDSSFVPPELTELTECSEGKEYLTKEAKESYDELCKASIESGLSLGVTSSYRSFESQQDLYNSYLKSNGQDYVNKYVATPGYSEHQTGLAVDVKSTKSSPFMYTKEYKWMLENSYKYGFILRYPENLENITGYNPEAWHFRYVGKEIAKYIFDNNITYEEYFAIFM